MGLLSWFKNKNTPSLKNIYDYDPNTENVKTDDREFEFLVHDVFFINGKGIIVTGEVSLGSINVNQTVYLEKSNGQTKEVIIDCIETFRVMKKSAERGESVGIVLKNVKRKDVFKGNRLYR